MPSLQTVSSSLQKLVGSPTRHKKRLPKLSQSSVSCTPFSPRITLLEHIDTTPLLNINASCSNSPSMLSAVTTTGVHSPPHSSSVLSSLSFSKSENCLPRLPALPFPLQSNTAESISKSNCDRQSEAVPSANVREAFPQNLGVPAEDSRFSVVADKEVTALMPGPSNPTERGGKNSSSTGPIALSEFPNSASDSSVQRDAHETYLNNLRLFHFGVTVETTRGEFLSEFPLIQSDDASWVEIDLQSYGWQD